MKFNLPVYTTNYFSTEVFVNCPKCNQRALVTSKPSKYILPINNEVKVECTSCSFKEESSDSWSGYCQGFLNTSCGFCGTKLNHSTKPTKEIYEKEKVKCNTCKNEKNMNFFGRHIEVILLQIPILDMNYGCKLL